MSASLEAGVQAQGAPEPLPVGETAIAAEHPALLSPQNPAALAREARAPQNDRMKPRTRTTQ